MEHVQMSPGRLGLKQGAKRDHLHIKTREISTLVSFRSVSLYCVEQVKNRVPPTAHWAPQLWLFAPQLKEEAGSGSSVINAVLPWKPL